MAGRGDFLDCEAIPIILLVMGLGGCSGLYNVGDLPCQCVSMV